MRIKQKNMKKPYQCPVTRELFITRTVPLLAGSNTKLVEVESGGGIDPSSHVDIGLGREFNIDDDDLDDF